MIDCKLRRKNLATFVALSLCFLSVLFQMIKGSTKPRTDWYVPVERISARILIFESSIKSLQPFFFN